MAKASFLDSMKQKVPNLLYKAQQLYGWKDDTYRFTGVIFKDDGPNIWFPTSSTCQEVQIVLNTSCEGDYDRALYQLSHEIVHLLAPNKNPPTIMLEEGAAVHFSIHAPKFSGPGYKKISIEHLYSVDGPVNYKDAYDLYQELYMLCPNAIATLRKKEAAFFKMTPDFIVETLGINIELATRLCECRTMR